jgi:hypothetical protein
MSERSLEVAPFPSADADTRPTVPGASPMSGHVDVLALIAEVEKRLGEVRTQVHGQHED